MVGGPLGVEAEHLGTAAHPSRRIGQSRECVIKNGSYGLLVEQLRELQTRYERTRHGCWFFMATTTAGTAASAGVQGHGPAAPQLCSERAG